MKRGITFGIIFLLALTPFILANEVGFWHGAWAKITGRPIDNFEEAGIPFETLGPSAEEQTCMKECVFKDCNLSQSECMSNNGQKCMDECNVESKPEGEEYSCMEQCISEGCSEYDFECQGKNRERCEAKCGMVHESEASSEEEQCIRDCVSKVDSTIQCQNSQEGETGNEVCQKCAQECVHLYAGPCLGDEEVRAKEKECQTCAHCYGEPVMGPSGEGWDCIVDVECMDASSEWGDNPGAQDESEGVIEKVGGAVGGVFESIGNFFSGLFGRDDNSEGEIINEESPIEEEKSSD